MMRLSDSERERLLPPLLSHREPGTEPGKFRDQSGMKGVSSRRSRQPMPSEPEMPSHRSMEPSSLPSPTDEEAVAPERFSGEAELDDSDWGVDESSERQVLASDRGSEPVMATVTAEYQEDGTHHSPSVQNLSDSTVAQPSLASTTSEAHDTDREGSEAIGNGSQVSADQPSVLPSPAPGTPDPEPGFLPVLRNRNFITLWSGQVFSQLADKVYLVLMIALIANRFQSADQTISGWVSSIMIAFTIPAVLFGSVAGVFVDRWPKKTVLVATNLLRGGLVLILPPLLWLSQGWSPLGPLPLGFCIVLGITFLVSTLTQFFAPAEQAAIPLIVERRHLLSANSLYTTTMMASVIIGFAVGEPILAAADAVVAQLGGAFGIGKELVVGGSYAIAGLILLLLKANEKGKEANALTDQEPPHVWQDIREGLRYLSEKGRVRAALIQLVILFSIFAALAVLAVRLAEVIPEIKSSQFGFLLAAGGVGMALGAVLLGQFGQRFSHAQLSLYGSIGIAASLAGVSLFSHRLIPTLLLLALLGCFAAIVGVPMQTTIQEETPEEMRGKVFGLQNNAVNIALTLPLALAGVAETFLGLQAVFLGLAGLAIAGGLLTWYISRQELTQ